MQNPEDLKYTSDHEWLKIEGNEAVVGITYFAQSELGELVFVELPEIGKTLKVKDQLCVVESTKAASDVYSPISGKVTAVNKELLEQPALINNDPYQTGWIARLAIADTSELEQLLSCSDYDKLLAK